MSKIKKNLYCLLLLETDNIKLCAFNWHSQPSVGTHSECLKLAKELRLMWPKMNYVIMRLVPAKVQS